MKKAIILILITACLLTFFYLFKDFFTEKETQESIDRQEASIIELDNSENDFLSEIETKIHKMTVEEINHFLYELSESNISKEEKLKKIVELRLGTPYQLAPMGEGDEKPIFKIDAVDCTTFVITTVSLLYSSDLNEAKEKTKMIHYHPPGNVSYENRLHFSSYRNLISPYFKEITEDIVNGKAIKKEVTLNRNRSLIDIDFEYQIEISYLSFDDISEDILMKLPSFVGVAFLRDGDESIGLDVRHEGFLVSNESLIHASSSFQEVVSQDFYEYIKDNRNLFDGLIFFEII